MPATTKTQKERILNHLERGKSLTQLQALDKFGCMRLASVVNKLKNEGYDIETTMVHNKKTDKNYASYAMA